MQTFFRVQTRTRAPCPYDCCTRGHGYRAPTIAAYGDMGVVFRRRDTVPVSPPAHFMGLILSLTGWVDIV